MPSLLTPTTPSRQHNTIQHITTQHNAHLTLARSLLIPLSLSHTHTHTTHTHTTHNHQSPPLHMTHFLFSATHPSYPPAHPTLYCAFVFDLVLSYLILSCFDSFGLPGCLIVLSVSTVVMVMVIIVAFITAAATISYHTPLAPAPVLVGSRWQALVLVLTR